MNMFVGNQRRSPRFSSQLLVMAIVGAFTLPPPRLSSSPTAANQRARASGPLHAALTEFLDSALTAYCQLRDIPGDAFTPRSEE